MDGVYISDLYGKLLGADARLSDFTRQTLTTLLQEGLIFTVATARSVFSMSRLMGPLPLRLPVVEMGGAFVSDYHTGRHLLTHAIDPALLPAIHDLMASHGCAPFVSTYDGERDRLYMPPPLHEGMAWYHAERRGLNDHRLVNVADASAAYGDQVICLNAVHTQEVTTHLMIALENTLGDRVQLHLYDNIYSPGWFWLTVHDREATKCRAVARLLAQENLDPAKLTVFGDDLNDLTLFDMAPTSVAVAGARPQVKARATHHIGPNTEDSVARYLLKTVSTRC